jgi:hypothetical protein
MIRKSMTIMFALLLLITAGTVVGAEMAKEGSGDYRSGKSGTSVVIAMGKERFQMNFEETGVVVSAPENSPFHNATFRDIGTAHGIKGKWKGSGFVEWTCTNGDKVYGTFESQGVMGGSTSAVLKFVGGTGAYTGIEGTLEMRNTPGIKPARKGIYQGITVGKLNWEIP